MKHFRKTWILKILKTSKFSARIFRTLYNSFTFTVLVSVSVTTTVNIRGTYSTNNLFISAVTIFYNIRHDRSITVWLVKGLSWRSESWIFLNGCFTLLVSIARVPTTFKLMMLSDWVLLVLLTCPPKRDQIELCFSLI